MKYITKYKIFENKININLNPNDYIDEFISGYDGEISDALVFIKRIIKRVKMFEFPFEAYLLDEENDIWTTSLIELENYNKENSIIKKAIINNPKDVDFDQTVRGRVLEIDTIYTKSGYISFNKESVKTEDFYISSIYTDIDEIFYDMQDYDIEVVKKLFYSFGETRNINIYNFEIVGKSFLPIDITISTLSRLDEHLKSIGFIEERPSEYQGSRNKNISVEMIGNQYMLSLDELDKRSRTFSKNLPFKQLSVNYYKYVN
jgi:hypothetical protein